MFRSFQRAFFSHDPVASHIHMYTCMPRCDDKRKYKHACENYMTNSLIPWHTVYRQSTRQAQYIQDASVCCANQIFATWRAGQRNPTISVPITGAPLHCRISKFWVTILTVYGKKTKKIPYLLNLIFLDGQDGHPAIWNFTKYGRRSPCCLEFH